MCLLTAILWFCRATFLAALSRALARAFPTVFTEYSFLLLRDLEGRGGASCLVTVGTTWYGGTGGTGGCRELGGGGDEDGGTAGPGAGAGAGLGTGLVLGWACDSACDNACTNLSLLIG